MVIYLKHNIIKFKTFILRNRQLQKAYTRKYMIAIYVEMYRFATLDYGQRWLVLNSFPNNKHQVIKFHILHKNVTLYSQIKYYNNSGNKK